MGRSCNGGLVYGFPLHINDGDEELWEICENAFTEYNQIDTCWAGVDGYNVAFICVKDSEMDSSYDIFEKVNKEQILALFEREDYMKENLEDFIDSLDLPEGLSIDKSGIGWYTFGGYG